MNLRNWFILQVNLVSSDFNTLNVNYNQIKNRKGDDLRIRRRLNGPNSSLLQIRRVANGGENAEFDHRYYGIDQK